MWRWTGAYQPAFPTEEIVRNTNTPTAVRCRRSRETQSVSRDTAERGEDGVPGQCRALGVRSWLEDASGTDDAHSEQAGKEKRPETWEGQWANSFLSPAPSPGTQGQDTIFANSPHLHCENKQRHQDISDLRDANSHSCCSVPRHQGQEHGNSRSPVYRKLRTCVAYKPGAAPSFVQFFI